MAHTLRKRTTDQFWRTISFQKPVGKEGNDPLPVLFCPLQPSTFIVDILDGVALVVSLRSRHGWSIKMGHFEKGRSGGTFKLNF